MIIFILLVFADSENTCRQKAIMNYDHSLNCIYFINCYIILILLTNTGTRLEQSMLVIQPPGTHRLADFSRKIPLFSDQGNPLLNYKM